WRPARAVDEPRYHQGVLDLCGWSFQRQDTGGVSDVAAHDVRDAVAYLKANPTSFPAWDGSRVAALGTSAGGTVLLDAVASTTDPEVLPDVAATWSATMLFAPFVAPQCGTY